MARHPRRSRITFRRLVAMLVTVLVAVLAFGAYERRGVLVDAPQVAPQDTSLEARDIHVYVHPNEQFRNRRFAVWGSLVRSTRTVVWNHRIPVDDRYRVPEVTLGRYVLSLMVAPCAGGNCNSFHGGTVIGLVNLRRTDHVLIDVTVSCRTVRSGKQRALDCSGSTVERQRET